MRTVIKMLIPAVLVITIMTGCATNPDSKIIDQTDPVIKALRAAPEIDALPPLDLSEYKRIEFIVVKDPDTGEKLIAMSPQDFELTTELLKLSANRIKLQRLTLQEVKKFFDERLGRSTMGGSDQDSSTTVQVETQ